jgi:hypothetical protein
MAGLCHRRLLCPRCGAILGEKARYRVIAVRAEDPESEPVDLPVRVIYCSRCGAIGTACLGDLHDRSVTSRTANSYAIVTLRSTSVYLWPLALGLSRTKSHRIEVAFHNGGVMTDKSMLRIVTPDAIHAVDIACSDVGSAVGLPVRAEFQEIEGGNLIIELQLGDEAEHTPHPSRLASAVDKAVPNMEVLSSWTESTSSEPAPRPCPDVLGVGYEPLPKVAQRALDDDLPTAKWERSDSCWHLAVPSVCCGKVIVGMSRRSGYSHRFTAHDAAALWCGLAS